MKDFGLSREVPVKRGQTALLFVDVQNYSAEGGESLRGFRRKLLKRDTDTSSARCKNEWCQICGASNLPAERRGSK